MLNEDLDVIEAACNSTQTSSPSSQCVSRHSLWRATRRGNILRRSEQSFAVDCFELQSGTTWLNKANDCLGQQQSLALLSWTTALSLMLPSADYFCVAAIDKGITDGLDFSDLRMVLERRDSVVGDR